jgi:Ca2+-binding EF-hand superfamily protein
MAGYEIASDLVQQFSKEEIAAYQEAFKKFDKDGNGFITRDEIKKALSELGQKVREGKGTCCAPPFWMSLLT